MIETSIINIIENAIKYGGEYQIDVVARTKGNRCLISVTDQGPGITENEQSNIFDKFYELKRRDKKKKKRWSLYRKQFIDT